LYEVAGRKKFLADAHQWIIEVFPSEAGQEAPVLSNSEVAVDSSAADADEVLRNQAATRIQKVHRGKKARKNLKEKSDNKGKEKKDVDEVATNLAILW